MEIGRLSSRKDPIRFWKRCGTYCRYFITVRPIVSGSRFNSIDAKSYCSCKKTAVTTQCGKRRGGFSSQIRTLSCQTIMVYCCVPVCKKIVKQVDLAMTFLANVNSICYRPSVCRLSVCLSSVTLVHPTQAVQLFGNISTAFGTLAIH